MGMRALFASCNHFACVELNTIKEASQGIHVLDSISRHGVRSGILRRYRILQVEHFQHQDIS